jgi:hypothetical protein
VFCVLFPAWWTHYLNSVSAAELVQASLSLLFLELGIGHVISQPV